MTGQQGIHREMKRFVSFLIVLALFLGIAATASATPLRQTGLKTDTNIADFDLGTVGSCFIGPSSADGNINGELTLLPTIVTDFSGASLPVGWAQTDTWQVGGGYTVSGGVLTVNGAAVAQTANRQSSGQTMEFVATFLNGVTNQHVGLGTSFPLEEPWAIFSTWNAPDNRLYARTTEPRNLPLGTFLDVPNRYKVWWDGSNANFYVNGAPLQTMLFTSGTALGPVISDYNGGTGLVVDWLRMSPYNTSCTFTSQVFDKTATDNWWNNLSATTDLPAGTTAVFQVRFGDASDTSDLSWTAWVAPSGGTGINSQHRYMQYQVALTTSNTQVTPVVSSVTLSYGDTPTAVTLQSITAQGVGAPIGIVVAGGLVLAAVTSYAVYRKRS
jgi:hypothetical protein